MAKRLPSVEEGRNILEERKVNKNRFLALVSLIAIVYSLATMHGQQMQKLRIEQYAGRLKEHNVSFHDKVIWSRDVNNT